MMFKSHMTQALKMARIAGQSGEVPVGAVLVNRSDDVVAMSGNRTRELNDPTAHAEILVIRERCRQLGSERLPDHDLYVTLEPCAMCAAAISAARISRLYFAALDAKSGGVEHGAKVFMHGQCHHVPEVYGGIGEEESMAMLKDFFTQMRKDYLS
ncbi:MAG: nucleoside deaminase [Aestuariivita sp.]|nr:nucleoside deaminase [Aestuariivita sp.]